VHIDIVPLQGNSDKDGAEMHSSQRQNRRHLGIRT